ncbi:MAG: hypothetical protein KL863_10915 [Rhizobium sp.]|nr:hypothetical protein [Rhizobium sp.]
MAKFKHIVAEDANIVVEGDHFTSGPAMEAHDAQTATLTSTVFPAVHIVLNGTGFTYEGSRLAGGTITSIVYTDEFDASVMSVTGLKMNASKLPIYVGTFDDILYEMASAGRDTVTGTASFDTIDGGKAKDTLTGGLGPDHFSFTKGDGKDKITDFDAKGGEGRQDFIVLHDVIDYDVEKRGKDTYIDLGGKDGILLIGVKASQVDESDFLFG